MNQVAFIYAHPDDETFLSACLIRQLADQGHKSVLLLATRGDAGQKNGHFSHYTKDELGTLREQEMMSASRILGLVEVEHLLYPDGKLNETDEEAFAARIVQFLNKHQSTVVVGFPEDGGNFHPDHMAVSKALTTAVLSGQCPSVQKLYYTLSAPLLEQGHSPSIIIHTEPMWEMKAAALKAHASQIFATEKYFGDLAQCPENRRNESFVLGWERGRQWPKIAEQSVFDGIVE